MSTLIEELRHTEPNVFLFDSGDIFTGALIMQTYGQATHLGYLQLTLDGQTGKIINYHGKLIPVDPSKWGPNPRVAGKLARYRSMYPEILDIVGKSSASMNRRYIEESDVGNLFNDAFVAASGADIGFVHSGSLRKDLPAGNVRMVDLLDTYPFVVATPSFLTEGGDLYDSFPESTVIGNAGKVSDVIIQYFRDREVVVVPKRGRQEDVTPTQ